MEVRKVLKPGDNGTKRLTHTYGNKLVCVRYRYDKEQEKRVTTVELIVDEQPWVPGRPLYTYSNSEHNRQNVLIKVYYSEHELRGIIKSHGGRWQPEEKAWLLDYKTTQKLGLENRIIRRDNEDN